MVGDHAIYGAILQTPPKRISILSITNWRIHQNPLSKNLDIILIEGQVLGAHLGSDEIAFVFL